MFKSIRDLKQRRLEAEDFRAEDPWRGGLKLWMLLSFWGHFLNSGLRFRSKNMYFALEEADIWGKEKPAGLLLVLPGLERENWRIE